MTMTNTLPDPVTCYLNAHGIETRTAYFDESEFEIGVAATFEELELIYRVKDDVMVVCNMQATAQGGSGAVAKLFALVHKLQRHVADIREVRCLVITDMAVPETRHMRQRLVKLIQRYFKGVKFTEKNGKYWFSYSMR
jgi:hypothetical protein